LPDGRAALGRPIKMLTLIDEFTKQALAIQRARRAYPRAGKQRQRNHQGVSGVRYRTDH
jgi:hypothetical protein